MPACCARPRLMRLIDGPPFHLRQPACRRVQRQLPERLQLHREFAPRTPCWPFARVLPGITESYGALRIP